MISMRDFEDEKGKVDFKAYHRAEIDAGERCYICDGYIMFAKGNKTKCYDCEKLEKNEEVSHFCLIRCPKCKATWDAHETEDYDLHYDGEHKISCYECGYDFEVITSVSYSFKSPELIEEVSK